MTREEAIARIKGHMFIHKMNEPRAIHISEALDMAIKALEKEPCEDAISRQAAIDAVNTALFPKINTAKDAEKALRALPSAQPDIIQCRNCKFASGDSRICMKFGHSPIGELDFCAWAESEDKE